MCVCLLVGRLVRCMCVCVSSSSFCCYAEDHSLSQPPSQLASVSCFSGQSLTQCSCVPALKIAFIGPPGSLLLLSLLPHPALLHGCDMYIVSFSSAFSSTTILTPRVAHVKLNLLKSIHTQWFWSLWFRGQLSIHSRVCICCCSFKIEGNAAIWPPAVDSWCQWSCSGSVLCRLGEFGCRWSLFSWVIWHRNQTDCLRNIERRLKPFQYQRF